MRTENYLPMVSEAIVRSEPRPAFTRSWHPFSHGDVIDAMAIAVKENGLQIIQKDYSYRPNSKMIAAWEIQNGEKEFNFGIGFRNSVNKSASVAVFLFTKIFVCSNWNFQSVQDWVLFRKHSGRLEMEEIIYYATEAVAMILPRMERFAKRQEDMKTIPLSTRNASLISVGAMSRGLLPPAKFPEFWNLYQGQNSKYREYGDSLYAWHGAMTELMKDNSLLTQARSQMKLNQYIGYEIPKIIETADRPETFKVDFKSIGDEGVKVQKADKEAARTELAKIAGEVRGRFKNYRKAAKKADAEGKGITPATPEIVAPGATQKAKKQAKADKKAAPAEKERSRLKKRGRKIVGKVDILKAKKKETKKAVSKEFAKAKGLPEFMKIKPKATDILFET